MSLRQIFMRETNSWIVCWVLLYSTLKRFNWENESLVPIIDDHIVKAVHRWVEEVLPVSASAKLILHGLCGSHVAVDIQPTFGIAACESCLTSASPVVYVLNGFIRIWKDWLCYSGANVVGSQIRKGIVWIEVTKKEPSGLILKICLLKVHRIGVDLDWDHVLCVEFNHVERRVPVLVSGDRSCVEVHTNVFGGVRYSPHNLDIFIVRVAVHRKSDDVLKPVHESSESVPPCVYALLHCCEMSDD